jgi:hypothetical protein
MAVTETKPGKKVVESTYVSGFCGIGSHEGAKNLSPSGQRLKSCPQGGRFDGGRLGVMVCTCQCHDVTRQMEGMTGIQVPALEINRTTPSLDRLLREAERSSGGAKGPGIGVIDGPSVTVASGVRFAVTPTGRAARGQLEEQVRYAICVQVKAGGEMIELLGLSPSTLAVMIDRENPPSTGAIYSVLKRWESNGMVDLAESPFRFIRFTERGKRELFR